MVQSDLYIYGPQEQCHRILSDHHLSEEGAREIVSWIERNHQFI